jgi:hypothetical protein
VRRRAGMDKKYDELLAFFCSVLKEISIKNLPLYLELLEEIKADGKRIQDAVIEDEDLKDVLKNIGYLKRIKKALEKSE